MLIQREKLEEKLMNSEKRAGEYCQPILDILADKDSAQIYFNRATKIIDLSGEDIEDKEVIKQVRFTDKLKSTFAEADV